MDSRIIYPDKPEKIDSTRVQQNIISVIQEIDSIKSFSGSTSNKPIYKTVKQFSFEKVFAFFGMENTPLFRLTQSRYSNLLPKLIVIHCNIHSTLEDDEPVIIDDKLFISHMYFKKWISGSDTKFYESKMLDLIMSQIDLPVTLTN